MPRPKWDQRRDVEAEKAAGVADFDARYAAFLRGESLVVPPEQGERRVRIESLITHGATEGERAAARRESAGIGPENIFGLALAAAGIRRAASALRR